MKSKKTEISRRTFCRLSGVAGIGFLTLGWKGSPSLVRRATVTMGSVLDLQIWTRDEDNAQAAISKVFAEFRRLDNLLSVFRASSVVSEVNRAAGKSEVYCGSEVCQLMTQIHRMSERTHGSFNPLMEPLMRLWGFREEKAGPPDDRTVAEALDASKLKNLVIDSQNQTLALLHPRSAIDLGGAGVGYAIDRAVSILASHDIHSALINHAGDVYALGTAPDGEPWTVQITDPADPRGFIHEVHLTNKAVSTSGNYASHRTLGRETVGHIFSPSNGKNPLSHLSLSVVSETAFEADALSTGFFCEPHVPGNLSHLSVQRVDGRLLLNANI